MMVTTVGVKMIDEILGSEDAMKTARDLDHAGCSATSTSTAGACGCRLAYRNAHGAGQFKLAIIRRESAAAESQALD